MQSLASTALVLALLTSLLAAAGGSNSSGSLDGDTITATSPPTPSTASPSSLQWTYYSRVEFEPTVVWNNSAAIESTTLDARVCYASLDGGCSLGNTLTHSLQIRRVMKETVATDPMIWVVHDPILSKQTPEQVLARLSKRLNASVYMVESRLLSNPPNLNSATLTPCGDLAANDTSALTIDSTTTAAVAKCTQWIETKFGTNGIRAYSIDSAVQDLALAISTTIPTTQPIYFYASGRGVRVVARLLSQNTNVMVAGVIYDSPLHAPLAEEPVGAAATRFIGACGDDVYCRDRFRGKSASLADVLKTTLETVDSSSNSLSTCFELLRNASFNPTQDLKPSHGVRKLFMGMRKASAGGSQAIPPVLYRLKRCNKFDVAFLKRFFGKTTSATVARAAALSPMVAFADLVTTFSESWPAVQSREKLSTAFESSLISDGALLVRQPIYCAFTSSEDASCTELYKDGATATKTSSLVYQGTKDTVPKVNALVLASRLSAIGAGTAGTSLYHGLAAVKSSDQTVIMVQSDSLLATEIDESASASLLRLVDAFLTDRARGLNGKWHQSDLDGFSLDASPPSATGVVSSLETKSANISFAMSYSDSKAWFQQYNPYEGYKIIMIRGGEQDDPMFKDDGGLGMSWEAVVVACVGALGLLYVLFMNCKEICCSCRPSAPPQYTTEPVQLPIQWNQPPLPPPQMVQTLQWQGQYVQTQQPPQQVWTGYAAEQRLHPTAPLWTTQGGATDGNRDTGDLVVQVHRL